MTGRLFTLPPTPAERRALRARNLRGQLAAFTLELEHAGTCPACAGTPDTCTCAATGAEALTLPTERN